MKLLHVAAAARRVQPPARGGHGADRLQRARGGLPAAAERHRRPKV